MHIISRISALLITSVALSACVSLPDVYLIDRHTVMETEASGEWPEVDQRFRQQAIKAGPTALEADPDSPRKVRSLEVLNSEFASDIVQP
jgi:hypothetical protein